MIGTRTFEEARASGQATATAYEASAAAPGKAHLFRRWALHELRTDTGIFPME
jgi:hypothetical protein